MPLRHTCGTMLGWLILTGIGDTLTRFSCRYEEDPSQEYLINTISISRSWSIQHLFSYAFDHFRHQFIQGQIHPAVVLGIAWKHGIPDLVGLAVKALAKPDIPLAGWCMNPEILHHVTLENVTKISQMKEKLWMAHTALCKVHPVIHDLTSCLPGHHDLCSRSRRHFWLVEITPKLLESSNDLDT